jgi:hypothetical protein
MHVDGQRPVAAGHPPEYVDETSAPGLVALSREFRQLAEIRKAPPPRSGEVFCRAGTAAERADQ